jgi:hypothetical protein
LTERLLLRAWLRRRRKERTVALGRLRNLNAADGMHSFAWWLPTLAVAISKKLL